MGTYKNMYTKDEKDGNVYGGKERRVLLNLYELLYPIIYTPFMPKAPNPSLTIK